MSPRPAVCLVLMTGLVLVACKPAPPAATPGAAAPNSVASATPDPAPPVLSEPLQLGSKDAKDDLYCAALVAAAYPQPDAALVPVDFAKITQMQDQAMALRLQGNFRLVDEKVALITQTGAVAAAWEDVAMKDYAEKKPRIPLKTCEARSEEAMKRALKAQ